MISKCVDEINFKGKPHQIVIDRDQNLKKLSAEQIQLVYFQSSSSSSKSPSGSAPAPISIARRRSS
jgi:hypothetical protein